MQVTCPCCAGRFSIEAAFTDDAARAAVAAALKFPAPLGEQLLRYVALFRPAQRALSWDRAARLLNELLEPISAGRVQRDGRWYPAPVEAWRRALEQMLDQRDRLRLPLKSHGYLIEILIGVIDEVAAESERRREESLRHRAGPRLEEGPRPVARIVERDYIPKP